MDTNKVGVIVGRFQVPELHEGHRHLIETALARHAKVLVAIGVSYAYANERDPLSYEMRKMMLKKNYPALTLAPVFDVGNDSVWSRSLDKIVDDTFPNTSAVMYGSRDSFLATYTGKHEKYEVSPNSEVSGTKLRLEVARKLRHSADFRSGMIYAQLKREPILYQAVDIAIIRPLGEVLLGQKKRDGKKYRFVGGFVDVGDSSLEAAALREVSEEVKGITVDDIRYLGSRPIADWRYEGTKDSVMTAFFRVTYRGGDPVAGDDLDDVRWVKLARVQDMLISEHRKLAEEFLFH
jgi:bifunctional NMN adenylyltransferase/nudix hydrolase